MDGNQLSVERVMSASPEAIFALLADAAQHSRFDGSGTVLGTARESRPLSLGTKFGMSMRMKFAYKTSNEVIELEPPWLIAWKTTGLWGFIGGRIWRYELEPQADGTTLVRETWDISQDKQRRSLKRSGFPAATKRNITATLDRLAELVESGQANGK